MTWQLDYGAYLDFLAEHGHNFIRLWRWEQFKSQTAGGDFHLCMTPQPWARTGPGSAKDGKPKFDLDRFDEAFFDRLRDRVAAAGKRGIYVRSCRSTRTSRSSRRRTSGRWSTRSTTCPTCCGR